MSSASAVAQVLVATQGALGWLRARWPSALGIVLAVGVGVELGDAADLAPGVLGMALIYLGATVLRKPAAAWALGLGMFVVIGVGKALGSAAAFATWAFVVIAAPLMVYAVGSIARRLDGDLLVQALATLGFGGAAVAAFAFGAEVGAYLAALGMMGHAIWDAYHHWANKVVVRSWSEFCCVVDALVAAVVVVLLLRG